MSNGYLKIRVKGKKRQLHRVLMQNSMNRQLLPSEDVHHVNENKRDNRLENLAVIPHDQHTALHRRKHPAQRKCAKCGELFKTLSHASRAKFCSIRCSVDANAIQTEIRDKAMAMRSTGMLLAQIASTLGISRTSVHRICAA